MLLRIVKIQHDNAVERLELLINPISLLIGNVCHHDLRGAIRDKLLLHTV